MFLCFPQTTGWPIYLFGVSFGCNFDIFQRIFFGIFTQPAHTFVSEKIVKIWRAKNQLCPVERREEILVFRRWKIANWSLKTDRIRWDISQKLLNRPEQLFFNQSISLFAHQFAICTFVIALYPFGGFSCEFDYGKR